MKTIIIYFSFTKNNELLAQAFQKQLGCDIYEIEEFKHRSGFTTLLDVLFNRKPLIRWMPLSLEKYDSCILVAPVWAGRIANPMTSFIREHSVQLVKYSFATFCGGGNPVQKSKIDKQLNQLIGSRPQVIEEFWINDLLPSEHKNKVKYTSGYRVSEEDLVTFEDKIEQFLEQHPIPV